MTTQPLRTIPARLLAPMAAALLMLAVLAHGAEAHGPPEHGHVLLLHATTVPNTGYVDGDPMTGPPVFPTDYERCVELANGRALPNHAHHTGAHTGRAGQALREQAGHLVVPLAPVGPEGWTGCAAIDQAFDK